jgi:hypothetical protein
VEVKPRRIRVAARGAALLEGPLGGEVRAADGSGDWEWELADADGDAEAGKHVAITLTKKCGLHADKTATGSAKPCSMLMPCHVCHRTPVSYDPKHQWSCAVDAPGHPQVDTARMTWERKRPWRPPQDARTLVRASRIISVVLRHATPYGLLCCAGGGLRGAAGQHGAGHAAE